MFLQFTKKRDYVMTNKCELRYNIVLVHIVLAQYYIITSQITNIGLKTILWGLHIIQSMIELYNLIIANVQIIPLVLNAINSIYICLMYICTLTNY